MVKVVMAALVIGAVWCCAAAGQGVSQPGAALSKHVCPAECEGDKAYDAAGKCPFCQSALKAGAAPAYTLTIASASGEVKGNETATLMLSLRDAAGASVSGVPVTVFVALRDLAWFAPVSVEEVDGGWKAVQAFPAGEFMVFAVFAGADGKEAMARARLSVSGKPANPRPMGVDADRPKTVDGVTVTLSGHQGLKAGVASELKYALVREGKPVAVEGASFVAIRSGLKPLLHGEVGADLTVRAVWPEAGHYRVWLRYSRDGRVSVAPFVVEVK